MVEYTSPAPSVRKLPAASTPYPTLPRPTPSPLPPLLHPAPLYSSSFPLIPLFFTPAPVQFPTQLLLAASWTAQTCSGTVRSFFSSFYSTGNSGTPGTNVLFFHRIFQHSMYWYSFFFHRTFSHFAYWCFSRGCSSALCNDTPFFHRVFCWCM